MDIGTPASRNTPREDDVADTSVVTASERPSSLCRWSIHCRDDIRYTPLPSPPGSPTANFKHEKEEQWPKWPAAYDPKEFTEKLSNGLESNDFSNVRIEELPLATDQIARAARRSPKELLEEALGFSIMGRNVELIVKLLRKIGKDLDDSGLYPFHLAVTYLDGAKTCCNVLDVLGESHPFSLRKLYVNDLGHTILDNLMMTILKAHTSCSPSIVDAIFKKEKRFEGANVDICGRWDADSNCIRTLLANGTSGIPFEWKHMFCHTSVQTICHSVGAIFYQGTVDVNTPSGLFMRRCLYCGLKLQLLPLHTLILVGIHLSQSGCKGETLFGILACLLSLLSNGADPLLKANVSLQALLGSEEGDDCSHEELDPAELVGKVLARLETTWSRELRTGWQVICRVLCLSQREWKLARTRRYSSSESEDTDHSEDDDRSQSGEDGMSIDEGASYINRLPMECSNLECSSIGNFFGRSKVLASLWAAVKTELLTYRRLREGDAWLSCNFDMGSLEKSLEEGGPLNIALVQGNMMNQFCDCGMFFNATQACTCINDAAAYYFSNLEDWNRSTFIWALECR